MKFCEKEDFEFPKLPSCMIYFLIRGEEVVYVGQTTRGIVRPLSHIDKEFDSIKVLYVERDKLDETEGYFIAKYKPIYNIKMTGYFRLLAARDKIRDATGISDFTVTNLKKECKKLGINMQMMNGLCYISSNDIQSVILDLKEVG